MDGHSPKYKRIEQHCFLNFPSGGRNSSVGSAWARCPQRRGFDPPLGTFSGRGDFSLGVNMGSNSIPPKTLSDDSINRGLVCAHMHFIARTQKILTFMSWTGECRQQKHSQHAPSTKTECDYLNGWIKKRSHTLKSHPGERKKKKKKKNPEPPVQSALALIVCHPNEIKRQNNVLLEKSTSTLAQASTRMEFL